MPTGSTFRLGCELLLSVSCVSSVHGGRKFRGPRTRRQWPLSLTDVIPADEHQRWADVG